MAGDSKVAAPVLLIVDDDPQLLSYLIDALEFSGYTLLQAKNGREALEIAAGQHVDVLLTDLVMPERDGVGLIRQLKERQPELRVVAMSGRSRTDLSVNSLELVRVLGADVVLQKPFTIDELEAAIGQLVGCH